MTRNFWAQIDADLDRIENEKPTTYAEVAAILNTHAEPGISAAPAFFGGGGDRTLFSALQEAGWRTVWAEAWYHYVALHPATGDMLTYCEGDVYPGDTRA